LSETARPQLFLPLRNRAVFREQSFDNDQGGLFVPGDVEVALGEEVVLEISFLEEQVRFRIRAQVKWKRPASAASRRALPGVGLAFLPSEAQTRQQLEDFVDGNAVDHVERDGRRYSLHLEIKVEGHGSKKTDDLSAGGCFLLWDPADDDAVPAIGTTLRLKLTAPGAFFSWITLPATVCWHRSGGERDGCGVQFQFGSERDRRRTEKLLAALRERLVRELRVQVPKAPTTSTLPAPTPTSRPPSPSMLPRK
jgi:Tfp pilus assembly protein PilZ